MKWIRGIIERPWLRIGMAVALIIVGLAPVGAPILSDNTVRKALGVSGQPSAAPVFAYRYSSRPDGSTQIERSQGGSKIWSGVSVIPEAVKQLSVASGLRGKLVFVRADNTIWRSEDSGRTWSQVQALPGRPLSMAVTADGDSLLVGTATKGLVLSSDRGQTWRAAGGPLTLIGPGELSVSGLAVNPADQQIVYANASYSQALPAGLRSVEGTYVSVDAARHWFAMDPVGAPGGASEGTAERLAPVANRPLAVTVIGKGATQTFELKATPALLASLDDHDAGTRAAAARALGLTGDASVLLALLQHLRDSDLAAGDRAAEAIGYLGDPSALPGLREALQDRDEVVRARAAYALGSLKDEASVTQLAEMLRNDGPLARGRAADGLAALDTPAAITALMVPLSDDLMTPARHAAMQGLESAGQPAVPQLEGALKDSNPVVRRNTAEILGWIKPAQAVPTLSQVLSDPDGQVRGQAAWALGEIGTVPAQKVLAYAASAAADPQTREASRQALAAAQKANAQNEARPMAPLSAVVGALALVPASRWTLLFVGILLATALLALGPKVAEQKAR